MTLAVTLAVCAPQERSAQGALDEAVALHAAAVEVAAAAAARVAALEAPQLRASRESTAPAADAEAAYVAADAASRVAIEAAAAVAHAGLRRVPIAPELAAAWCAH